MTMTRARQGGRIWITFQLVPVQIVLEMPVHFVNQIQEKMRVSSVKTTLMSWNQMPEMTKRAIVEILILWRGTNQLLSDLAHGLLKHSTTAEITLEELSPHKKELYLCNFLPHNPAICQGSSKRQDIF